MHDELPLPPDGFWIQIPDTMDFGSGLDDDDEFMAEFLAYMATPIGKLAHPSSHPFLRGGPAIAHPDIVDGTI